MGSKPKTDFLVASPSLISGAGRLFDWYGQFDEYNISRTPDEADARAIASDWAIVGNDICDAMAEYDAITAK
ncbi:MAG: hypothetical protein HIU91_10620 [Acidobacteria bacterium]|nr:hypothetical protein [Acidobacteriota bacterium]